MKTSWWERSQEVQPEIWSTILLKYYVIWPTRSSISPNEYCTISICSSKGVTCDRLDEYLSPSKSIVTWDVCQISGRPPRGGLKNRFFSGVWHVVTFLWSAALAVTRDNWPISSTSTGPVTRDGRTYRNGTVVRKSQLPKICTCISTVSNHVGD
jgi:hypothetical protein